MKQEGQPRCGLPVLHGAGTNDYFCPSSVGAHPLTWGNAAQFQDFNDAGSHIRGVFREQWRGHALAQ